MDFVGINQFYKQNVVKNKKISDEDKKINLSADTTSFGENSASLEQLAKNNQCLVRKNTAFCGTIKDNNPYENNTQEELISILSEMTNIYGEQRFSPKAKRELKNLPVEKLRKAAMLAEMETDTGFNRFKGYEIIKLINLEDSCFEKIPELAVMKNVDNEYLFCGEQIAELLNGQDKTFERLLNLITIKNDCGKQKYTFSDLLSLVKLTNDEFKVFKTLPEIDLCDAITLIKSNRRIDLLSFKDRSTLLKQMETIYDKYKNNEQISQLFNLDEMKQKLSKSIIAATSPIEVPQEAKRKFFQQAITINNAKTLKTIQNMSEIITKYGKSGFPLAYNREVFVHDLYKTLNNLSESQRNEILQKLDIEFTEDNSGYNGLLNINNLDDKEPAEREVKDLCKKFLLKNSVQTGDKNVDIVLNSLIQGLPEFVNVIGKKHHKTHQYTIDAHIIKVLQEALSNPKFSELSNIDKLCLQMAIILHDIGKKEGVVDKEHEFNSSRYAYNILQKFNLPLSEKDRIVEIIKNHNWWEKLSKGLITPEDVAVIFRHPNDLTIAEIFTKADLKGVSENFYNVYILDFETKILDCKAALNKFYQGGNMLFTTKIINPDKIPTQEFNGHKYKVFDFPQIPDNADLFDYGLNIHKKSEFRALFHAGNFAIVKKLSNPVNEGLLSTTFVCAGENATCSSADIGLMLDAENANIINSRNITQSSHCQRDFNNFVNFTLGNTQQFRFEQRKIFLDSLKMKYNLNEEQYGKLYEKIIDKKFIMQIKDIVIDGITVKKEDVINAYREFEEYMMQYIGRTYNEINIYNPKIKGIFAKVNYLSDISEDDLKFARENDLPIFILGKKNKILLKRSQKFSNVF